MKKLFYAPLLVVTFALFSFNSNSISNSDSKTDSKTEYSYYTDSQGNQTCYARHCEYTSDPYGNEYKSCSEWEEVPCSAIEPAKIE